MADMGHYSLWTVFKALGWESPTSVEPMLSHTCEFKDNVAARVKNDFSFPTAATVRFKFPAHGNWPAMDLIWYEGGMRPPTPPELEEDKMELPAEGMMFVGRRGKILAGFHVDHPRLIPERRMRKHEVPEAPAPRRPAPAEVSPSMRQWMAATQGGAQPPSSFLNAWPITEAVNLYAVALRTGRKLQYDAENRKIANVREANKYLSREYRPGWAPQSL